MNIKKLRELKKNKKGFTLIEIIVVVVILAVLLAVAVPSVLNYLGEADNAKYMSTAHAEMTNAQAVLAKDYATSTNKAAWTAGGVTITKTTTGTPEVTSVAVSNADKTATTPDAVKAYVITFADTRGGQPVTATITVNDQVTISPEK